MKTYWHAVGENLWLALDTLRTHKFRSLLTVLGVFIGTTTVILVASIIAGLDTQLVQAAEQFGTRVVWIYKLQMGTPHRLTREERLRKPLSYEDAMAIKEQCPAVEEVSVALFGEMEEFGLPPSTARFKGREMAHTELGWKMLNRMTEIMSDVAVIENHPRMEGRMLSMILSPKPH